MILTQFVIFSTLLLALPAIWVWRWPDLWGWALALRHRFVGHGRPVFLGACLQVGEMSAVAPFEIYAPALGVFVGWLIWGERFAGDLTICRLLRSSSLGAPTLPIASTSSPAKRRRAALSARPAGDACALRSQARAFSRCASVMCTRGRGEGGDPDRIAARRCSPGRR